MAARSESIETGIVGGGGAGAGDEGIGREVSSFEQEALIDNGGVSFHQTVGVLHTFFNRLSKWIVALTFSGFILLKHDAFTFWATMGSVINVMLSLTLKKTLKQERPVSGVSSGHGMPSSHAQSIFYAIIFVITSVFKWQGFNGATAIVSTLVVAFGSYFSWLRVSQRYHTTSQVLVGVIVGSFFSILWFWTWETTVHKAYDSHLWVRILVVVGAAFFSLGFISHVIRKWVKEED